MGKELTNFFGVVNGWISKEEGKMVLDNIQAGSKVQLAETPSEKNADKALVRSSQRVGWFRNHVKMHFVEVSSPKSPLFIRVCS